MPREVSGTNEPGRTLRKRKAVNYDLDEIFKHQKLDDGLAEKKG